jgi:hypothetical protein
MPTLASSFFSSLPGPWVGGATGGGDSASAGHDRSDPQKKSSTPQAVQRFVAGSQTHMRELLEAIYCHSGIESRVPNVSGTTREG